MLGTLDHGWVGEEGRGEVNVVIIGGRNVAEVAFLFVSRECTPGD